MIENLDDKLLNENESHVDVLIPSGQEINKKLTQTELLVSRYKIIHNIGLLLISTSNIDEAKEKLINLLSSSFGFKKIILLSVADTVNLIGQSGYTDERAKSIFESIEVLEYLKRLFGDNISYDAIYVENNSKTESLLDLNTFLIGRVVTSEYLLYIIAGNDSEDSLTNKTIYPMSSDDSLWFIQICLLWNSFLMRVKLSEKLSNKIAENNSLIQEKERQVEERTRTLLEALFDAKKYKLALELADIMVVLADTSSHKIIYANEQFEKISGYDRGPIVSRKALEFFSVIPLSGAIGFFTKDFDDYIKSGKTVRGMYVVRVKDGSEKQLDLSTSRFKEDEGGSIYVIIGRDVTNERSIQKRETEYAENIEKLNKLIINRELRIIELKRRVAQNI